MKTNHRGAKKGQEMLRTVSLTLGVAIGFVGSASADTAKLKIHGAENALTVTVYDQNASGKVVVSNKHVGDSEIVDTGVDVVVAPFNGTKQCYVRTVEVDDSTTPPTARDGTQHEQAGDECLIYLGLPSTPKKH